MQAAKCAKSSMTPTHVASCIMIDDTGINPCHFFMYLHGRSAQGACICGLHVVDKAEFIKGKYACLLG